MGMKSDVHELASEAALSAPVLRASGTQRWLAPAPLALGAVLLTILALVIAFRPIRVQVAAAPRLLPHNATAARAAAALGWQIATGNLVAVNGQILRSGAGACPLYWINGKLASDTTRLHNGDKFVCVPGHDRSEPIRERAELLAPVCKPEMAFPAVAGLKRVQVGAVSGRKLVEVTTALATVVAPPVKSHPKALALTFDDGPYPAQTSQILAILRKHNARATFFVLGELSHYWPKTVQAEVAQGCEVGLHTWNHANLTHLSGPAITADLTRTQAELHKITGQWIHLMRPPYGAVNKLVNQTLKADGYHIILWSGDTDDWQRPPADVIYSRIMRSARTGAIILCHDGGGPRSHTIAAVSRAVPALQERGFQLATVSEVLGLKPMPEGGALLIAGQRWEAKALQPALGMTLDGKPVAADEAPVELGGQLLVPARPLLGELKLKWNWNQDAQKLWLRGPREELLLRVNSFKIERGDGLTEQLAAPPVIYRSSLMIPLWVVMQASGATAQYDAGKHKLDLFSANLSAPIALPAPPNWGREVKWRDYLAPTTTPTLRPALKP
jgi:peptidoglycan/xylan/chitin deacetylase (PgdA/CDA1 family)